MSTNLDQARARLDAGETKKAAQLLWDAEAECRGDLDNAQQLRELASRLRDESSGRVQKDALLLIDYANRHITRLLTPEPSPETGILFEVLGGFGWEFVPGSTCALEYDAERITFTDRATGRVAAVVAYEAVTDIEIGGPGEVTSGGGFAGGGFGLEGAAVGMLAAGMLNALTTRSKIITMLSLHTTDAEVFLLHTTQLPFTLRIALSELFVRVRRAKHPAS